MDQQSSAGTPADNNGAPKKGRLLLGRLLIIVPLVTLLGVFIAYAVVAFITAQNMGTTTNEPVVVNFDANGQALEGQANFGTRDLREGVMQITTVILGFIGILSFIGILIGLPLGAYLLVSSQGDRFPIKKALAFGWEQMKKHFWVYLGALILMMIFNYAPSILSAVTAEQSKFVFLVGIITLVGFVLNIYIQLGLVNTSLKIVDGQAVSLQSFFPSPILVLRFVWASIIFMLIVIAGFILLIIPGIIWSYKFGLYPYLILDGKTGFQAIKESGRITKGFKLDLFFLALVLGLINFVGAILLLIGLTATIPLTAIASAYIYRAISKSVPVATTVPTTA